MHRVLVGSILGLLALTAAGTEPEARYMIEMQLWIDGEQIGEPMVVVEPGEPATVSDGGADDAGPGWRIEVEVQAPESGAGLPGRAIWLDVRVEERRDGEWLELTDSILGVPEGEFSELSIAPRSVSDPRPGTSSLFFRARTSRLKPGQQPTS